MIQNLIHGRTPERQLVMTGRVSSRPQAAILIPTEPSPKILTPLERNSCFPFLPTPATTLTHSHVEGSRETFAGVDYPWDFPLDLALACSTKVA